MSALVAAILSDLYSVEFYDTVLNVLKPSGVIVTQATGPLSTSKTFWSIYASPWPASSSCFRGLRGCARRRRGHFRSQPSG